MHNGELPLIKSLLHRCRLDHIRTGLDDIQLYKTLVFDRCIFHLNAAPARADSIHRAHSKPELEEPQVPEGVSAALTPPRCGGR